MLKEMLFAAIFAMCLSGARAQEQSSYAGMPSVRYQGSEYGSLFASVTQYQGEKAIAYQVGFQPGKGWGVSGILSGGKSAYFGVLYVTADKVYFVASHDKDEKLNWSVDHSAITFSMTGDGMEIKTNLGQPDEVRGLIHFQPIEIKTGKMEFDKPDEPSFLHKRSLDPPMEAFLRDFNESLNSFDETYSRLLRETGAE